MSWRARRWSRAAAGPLAIAACDVLRQLLDRGGPVATARLVHHAARAGDDAAVRRYAPEAARQASALGAHREAAAHYQTALDHTAADDIEAAGDAVGGAAPTILAHRPDRRGDRVVRGRPRAAAQQGNLLKAGDDLRWLSRFVWFGGRGEHARRLAMEAVEVLEQLPPGPGARHGLQQLSQLYMLSEDGPEAVQWGERALELAERLGLTEILVHALNNVGTAELLMGDPRGSPSSSAA